MKRTKCGFFVLGTVCATFLAMPVLADTYDISDVGADAYHGAAYKTNPDNNPDVIGGTNDFEIFGANLSFVESVLTVSIHTNFAGKGDNGLFSGNAIPTTDSSIGIGYGDVFLGSVWTPNGTASHYKTDSALNGTIWQYGLALDNRNTDPTTAAMGDLTLYSLGSNPNRGDYLNNIKLSDEFIVNAGFRHDQEVAVNTDSTDVMAIRTGKWWVDDNQEWVNFQIDLAGTGLMTSDEIALHWGLTCANDVIEGKVANGLETPIPAAVWLFGTALAGMFGFTRRKRANA